MVNRLTKTEQTKLMTPEERFALDCREIIRPELAKILTTPLRSRQCIDRGLAENWYRMMFEPYIRSLGALVGCDAFEDRVQMVIITVVGYMTQHVEPGEPGQAKRARFCTFIQHYMEKFRPWEWSLEMVQAWHPSKLEKNCQDFIDMDLMYKSVAEQTASLECLLDDMKDKIDWERMATRAK
ncbi:glycosyl transferase [Pestalotiopsis sp. IQ-011]